MVRFSEVELDFASSFEGGFANFARNGVFADMKVSSFVSQVRSSGFLGPWIDGLLANSAPRPHLRTRVPSRRMPLQEEPC